MPVKAIFFSQQDVGKNIKSSKKRYTWKFSIDGSDFTIELFASTLSGKKKVTLNGATKYESSSYGNFQWSTVVKNNQCMIYETHDTYDLRINNQSFNHLYQIEKTKKEFQFEDGYKESKYEENDFVPQPKSKSFSKSKTTNKPLNQEEDFDSIGFDHGFERFAPREDSANLNVRPLQKNNSPQRQQDGFSAMQNQFSKPPARQSLPVNVPPPVSQKPKQPEFSDFNNFGQTTQTTGKDPFANFQNFGFEEQPKKKENPFDFNQPSQQQYQQQSQPQKPKTENLIDFLSDDPEPIQQQQQAPVQQKSIPQELLDIFDDPVPPQQNIGQTFPPQQGFQPQRQQPLQQQTPFGNYPLQQQQQPQVMYPPKQQQSQNYGFQQPPMNQSGFQQQISPINQTPYGQNPLYGQNLIQTIPFQQQAPRIGSIDPMQPPLINQSQNQPRYGSANQPIDILGVYNQPPPPQPVQKSTPFDDLF